MILAILQARMSSSRLPGKVLKKVNGRELLDYEISRLILAKEIDRLIVATSIDETDNEIEFFCKKKRIECYRGSLEDVLERYYQCANLYKPNHVVRITGDCPLIDPDITDHVIQQHLKNNADYTSNTITPTYPDGMDVEVMKFDVLEEIWKSATLPSHKEHVTKYIHDNMSKFKVCNVEFERKSRSNLRWTVDNEEDVIVIETLIKNVDNIDSANIYDFLSVYDKEELRGALMKNGGIKRNEGLFKSLINDKLYHK